MRENDCPDRICRNRRNRRELTPAATGVIVSHFLDTFILSLAIGLLILAIEWIRAFRRGDSRLRPHPLVLTYALIPLMVSLGLRGNVLPQPGAWVVSLLDGNTYLERRCRFVGKFAPTDDEKAIRAFIKDCADRYDMDPLLIHAVVSVESDYDPNAVSSRGAMGLMQLTAQTVDHIGVRDPFDPGENIEGGIYYLKALLSRYKKKLRLALAAYNAGPEKVKEYRGVPPFPETKQFVRKVMKEYRKLRTRNRKNIAEKPKG